MKSVDLAVSFSWVWSSVNMFWMKEWIWTRKRKVTMSVWSWGGVGEQGAGNERRGRIRGGRGHCLGQVTVLGMGALSLLPEEDMRDQRQDTVVPHPHPCLSFRTTTPNISANPPAVSLRHWEMLSMGLRAEGLQEPHLGVTCYWLQFPGDFRAWGTLPPTEAGRFISLNFQSLDGS